MKMDRWTDGPLQLDIGCVGCVFFVSIATVLAEDCLNRGSHCVNVQSERKSKFSLRPVTRLPSSWAWNRGLQGFRILGTSELI